MSELPDASTDADFLRIPPHVRAEIEAIHASPFRAVVVTTGGATLGLAWLTSVPGASDTLLEGRVPYSASAVVDFLNAWPDQFCSPQTARALAMTALLRSCDLAEAEAAAAEHDHDPFREEDYDLLLGIACTASLATDRPKRGAHRVHLAVQSTDLTRTWSLELAKGARRRAEEEQLVAEALLQLLAEACGVESRRPALRDSEKPLDVRTAARDGWRDLLLGKVDAVCVEAGEGRSGERGERGERGEMEAGERGPGERAEGERQEEAAAATVEDEPYEEVQPEEAPIATVIFPGAFHPLHDGHLRMAEVAKQRLGGPVEFEISMFNVDKAPLDYTELATRVDRFGDLAAVWLTRAPTFREKSTIFPGCTFVVGTDTVSRLVDPRYYTDEHDRDAALTEIAERGCRFLVFGRASPTRFVTLDDLQLPDTLRNCCEGVSEQEFREDISSTEVRKQPGSAE